VRRIARSSQLPNASFFTQAEISRQAEMTEGAVLYIYDKERQLVGAKRLSDGSVEAYSQTDDSLFLSTRVLQYQGTERGPRAKIIGSYTELQKVSDDGQLLWNLSNPNGTNAISIRFIQPLEDGGAVVLGGIKDTVNLGDTTVGEDGKEQHIVARVSSNGEWLWARPMTPLRDDIDDGQPVELRVTDTRQVTALALIKGIFEADNPAKEAIGRGTYENVFNLETGELEIVRGPQLFPGNASAFTITRNALGEGVWLGGDSILVSGVEGEFSFLFENLFRELVRLAPIPGIDPNAVNRTAGASLKLFSNGDVLVMLGGFKPSQNGPPTEVLRWFGLVSRNGELQGIQRIDFNVGGMNIVSGDRISLKADDQETFPDTLFNDFKRVEGDSFLYPGRVIYERIKGPFSGLWTFNGGWRHHSDLAWVLPLDNGWFYSQALDAFVWTEPSAKSGNFWAFNSKTGDWLFSVVSNDGLLYSANTKSWIRINQ
jgi:hypothetical protein